MTEETTIENIEFLPKKRGPKGKYEPWMCNKIIEVASQGGHIAEMCMAIGIKSEDTFHRWKKDNQEFEEAYGFARTVSKAWWEKQMRLGALGLIPGFNATTFITIMNNKFPEDYKRNASGGTGDTQINITNNTLALSNE